MEMSSQVQQFWTQFVATAGDDATDDAAADNVAGRFYEAFHFDDNEVDANALVELVLQGTKRATASLLWGYEISRIPLPKAGDLSVVTDWQGQPRCIIESTHVEVVSYEEVSEAFAAIEGEGDGSLRYWLEEHWLYFSRECQRLGKTPSLQMPVVCEQFKVIYPRRDA